MAADIIYTVTKLNEYADRVLKNDLRLRSIKVSGEVSGFKSHGPGHLYFTLKDEDSSLPCVMFRSSAALLKFAPEDGMKVIARGAATIYPKTGKFQLQVSSLSMVGQGELYLQYLMLKERLEREGVFANERPLPKLPRAIGIATSPTGAVLHDMLKIIRQRFPNMRVITAPCSVQGANAPREIAAAIKRLADSHACDVIIVGRGGGSFEDLFCFNDEGVARAIASCPVPVISGVGHQTDFTIADLAADLRVATPTEAAEKACPRYDELADETKYDLQVITRLASARIAEARAALEGCVSSAAMSNPRHTISIMREKLHSKRAALQTGMNAALRNGRAGLLVLRERLRAMGPDEVLRRGYSYVTDEEGGIINEIAKLSPGQSIRVNLRGGSADAKVTSVEGSKTDE